MKQRQAFAGLLITAIIAMLASAAVGVTYINSPGGSLSIGNASLVSVNESGKWAGIAIESPESTLEIGGSGLFQDANKTPSIIGAETDSIPSSGTNILVSGKYAYLGSYGNRSITIYDISNPNSPGLVGFVTSSQLDGARGMAKYGNYLYVASEQTLAQNITIIDVSNATSPRIVGPVQGSVGSPTWVYISGKYLYATEFSSALQIFDLTNPTSPAVVSSVSSNSLIGPYSVVVKDNYAYVTGNSNNSLTIIDVSNKSSPVINSTISDSRLNGTIGVAVSGEFAYVSASSNDSMTIISLKNRSNPVIVSSITDTRLDSASGISVSGNYVYVSSTNNRSFTVIDVTNRSSPFIVTSYTNSALLGITYHQVLGKYAYITTNSPRLQVLDLAGIESPAANIGSLSAGSLGVAGNAQVAGEVYAGTGITIGGSVMSQGLISSSSLAGCTFFRVVNSTVVCGKDARFRVTRTSDQNVSSTWTKVNFTSESTGYSFDPDSVYDNNTNFRFVPPENGIYYLGSTICFENAARPKAAAINVSGTHVARQSSAVTTISDLCLSIEAIVPLTTSDTVHIDAEHFFSSGTATVNGDNQTTNFWGYRVG